MRSIQPLTLNNGSSGNAPIDISQNNRGVENLVAYSTDITIQYQEIRVDWVRMKFCPDAMMVFNTNLQVLSFVTALFEDVPTSPPFYTQVGLLQNATIHNLKEPFTVLWKRPRDSPEAQVFWPTDGLPTAHSMPIIGGFYCISSYNSTAISSPIVAGLFTVEYGLTLKNFKA